MKKLRLLFSALVLLLCSTSLLAHDFEVDGIYYNITSSDYMIVEVTYKGEKHYSYEEYSGSVIIPESVIYDGKTYRVMGIGEYAFMGCPGLTSVKIPNSVMSIGIDAISDCDSLTSVVIPNGVTTI